MRTSCSSESARISGLGRQHILALPRAQRKRILFEELARFLDTPGGEQIVAESYAQLRKHNCWAVSVIQQYARFKGSRIRAAVIGNAKQFFLMRQNDRGDLADLARDLPLPETTLDAIQRYPLPEQLPADQRHSSLCFFTPSRAEFRALHDSPGVTGCDRRRLQLPENDPAGASGGVSYFGTLIDCKALMEYWIKNVAEQRKISAISWTLLPVSVPKSPAQKTKSRLLSKE